MKHRASCATVARAIARSKCRSAKLIVGCAYDVRCHGSVARHLHDGSPRAAPVAATLASLGTRENIMLPANNTAGDAQRPSRTALDRSSHDLVGARDRGSARRGSIHYRRGRRPAASSNTSVEGAERGGGADFPRGERVLWWCALRDLGPTLWPTLPRRASTAPLVRCFAVSLLRKPAELQSPARTPLLNNVGWL